jgi:TfoX/Sxy family transcriptional regulator of competence genes
MASDQSTADFITEQMSGAGETRNRKMFGEYAVYCDDKVVALICDNKLFIKILDATTAVVRDKTTGSPYPGAKPYYVVSQDEWDDAGYLSQLARVTAAALPAPKPRRGK